MNKFLKVTILGLILSNLLSATAHAKSALTCTKEDDKSVVATVNFHEFGFINEISLAYAGKSEVIFSTETDEDMQNSIFTITPADLKNNSFLAAMKSKALLGKTKYKTVSFESIVSKEIASGDLNEITEYISDDGAGFGLLKFEGENYKLLKASLFLGWAGVYNECK